MRRLWAAFAALCVRALGADTQPPQVPWPVCLVLKYSRRKRDAPQAEVPLINAEHSAQMTRVIHMAEAFFFFCFFLFGPSVKGDQLKARRAP